MKSNRILVRDAVKAVTKCGDADEVYFVFYTRQERDGTIVDFDLIVDIASLDLRRYTRVRPFSEHAADFAMRVVEQIVVQWGCKVTKVEVESRKYNGHRLECGESSDRCDDGHVVVELH